MRHLQFDDEQLAKKLAAAYPTLSADERTAVLVELMLFVRALAGLVERDTSRGPGEDAEFPSKSEPAAPGT